MSTSARIARLDTAGARITTRFLSVTGEKTVGEIKNLMFDEAKKLDVTDYVYVVDGNGALAGVYSLKELVRTRNEVPIGSVMKRNPVTIDYHADQERIVYLVLKHKLKAIPVVDRETRRLEGIVPYDAIISIFNHEFREDILRSGGIHHGIKEIEEMATPASRLFRARIPSLAIGLAGGLLAASIITGFEGILSSHLTLAAFIPLMVYLSDAVGTQSQTLVVRMIALEPGFSVSRYLFREMRVGGAIGITFALLLMVAATLGWNAPIQIILALGTAMFASIVFQSFIATYLSILLNKFNVDPAVTSGPLTTIISDVSTLAMYFTTASLLLQSI
ncbi:MAG: magnesium transporter [Nitrososphaera sp.]